MSPRRPTRAMRRWRAQYGRYPSPKWMREVLFDLLRASTWKRHPAPFAKTERGKARRQERQFVETIRREFAA